MVRLALPNQHAIRQNVGLCVFERFQLDSDSFDSSDFSDFSPRPHCDSNPHGPIIPQPQHQITSGQASSLAMVLGYFRAMWTNTLIWWISATRTWLFVFFVGICYGFLRGSSTSAALWLGAPTYLLVEAISTIPHT